MSNVVKSKPEQLCIEVQKLKDLCYRDKDPINSNKDDLTENNILQSCNKCLQKILDDLEIKKDDEVKQSANVLDKIQINLLTFEANVLGTRSMAREGTTIEILIEQCTHIRTRMEAGSYCNIF